MSVPHLWCDRQWVGILVPAPAENLYQSSVKFLSHFRSPWPKSLCRSESFRNLYCLHSEGAKNENVLEYSSIWLYEKRNVLISHKRLRKRGLGHQNNFLGGGGGENLKKDGSIDDFHNGGQRESPGSSCMKARLERPNYRVASLFVMASTPNISNPTFLTENDIPGASLLERKPEELKISDIKFLLKCCGDAGTRVHGYIRP